ncbi:MAG: hypothetical protein ACOX7U_00450 [Desulfitobacteriia bacterium]|jgi:hypothetical protein
MQLYYIAIAIVYLRPSGTLAGDKRNHIVIINTEQILVAGILQGKKVKPGLLDI